MREAAALEFDLDTGRRGERDSHIESSLAEPPDRLVPNLRLQRFPAASHWVHMDEPEAVNSALTTFLDA